MPFRAIECRRPLARAVNMGISAVIDGNGRVLGPAYVDQLTIKESHQHILQEVSMWHLPWGGAVAAQHVAPVQERRTAC